MQTEDTNYSLAMFGLKIHLLDDKITFPLFEASAIGIYVHIHAQRWISIWIKAEKYAYK